MEKLKKASKDIWEKQGEDKDTLFYTFSQEKLGTKMTKEVRIPKSFVRSMQQKYTNALEEVFYESGVDSNKVNGKVESIYLTLKKRLASISDIEKEWQDLSIIEQKELIEALLSPLRSRKVCECGDDFFLIDVCMKCGSSRVLIENEYEEDKPTKS